MPKSRNRRTNTRKTQKVDQGQYPITASQLDQIASLQAAIKNNATNQNQVIARLSTSLLYMIFYSYYLSGNELHESVAALEDLSTNLANQEMQVYRGYISFLNRFCSITFPTTTSIFIDEQSDYYKECLLHVLADPNAVKFALDFHGEPSLSSWLRELKKIALYTYSYLCHVENPWLDSEFSPLLTEHGIVTQTTTAFLDNEILKRKRLNFYELIGSQINPVMEDAQRALEGYSFIFSFSLAFLSQAFVINPGLNYLFPNGLFLSPPPTPHTKKPMHLLTQGEARSYTQSLNTYKQSASYYTNSLKKFIRLASIVLIGMFFWEFLGEGFSGVSLMLYLSLGYAAVSNLMQDARDHWQYRQLPSKLATQISMFEGIVEGLPAEVNPIWGETLSTTLITINFEGPRRSKPEKLAKTLKACFFHHGIDMLDCKGTQITVQADLNVSTETAQAVKQLFNEHLDTENNIINLKKQIDQLLKYCGVYNAYFHYIPSYDKNFIPIVKIACDLPPSVAEAHGESISKLFAGNKVTWSPYEDHISLVIKGAQPADKNDFSLACKTISDKVRQEVSHSFLKKNPQPPREYEESSPQIQQATSRKELKDQSKGKKYKGKGKAPEQKAFLKHKSESSQMPLQNRPDIPWTSGIFRFNSNKNKITPIRSNFFGKYAQFSIFRVPRDHFPDDMSADKFESLITEDPSIVSPKGCQGLVYTNRLVRNPVTKKWFIATLKAKLLGKYGNIRIFAEPEVGPNGEILHVFNTLDLKSHSRGH